MSAPWPSPARDALSRAQMPTQDLAPGESTRWTDLDCSALEAREALLTIAWSVAARLPKKMLLRGGEGKWLMKRALASRLPSEILHRRKMGFVTPVSAWFRGPLAKEAAAIAHGSALAETGWFDSAEISRLADAHRSGRSDHGRQLWQLLMLEKSLQRVFGLGGGFIARPDRTPRRNRARRAAR